MSLTLHNIHLHIQGWGLDLQHCLLLVSCHWLRTTWLCACAQTVVYAQEPQTWSDEYGYDSFDHVYLYTLFLGQDAQGNMLPVRQLRDRYSQQRRDVHPKEDIPDKSQDEPETD